MARKKTKVVNAVGSEGNLASIDVVDILSYAKECMVVYGGYTLQDRAIPELKDGLKPVYRRLLWAGYTGGYSSRGSTKKCARIVGDCLGKYHPHGDAPVYGALVTIAKTAEPLFSPQGNFGDKALGAGPAAPRYTEAKLSAFSDRYLLDKDYLAVTPMVPNYDGKDQEPVYLPAKLPVLLTQGIEGIATGAATVIPSFSVESVKELTMKAIKSGKCTAKMCYNILDFKFAEGGEVWADEEELLSFYKTGEGKLFIAPICEYDAEEHAVVMTSYCPRLKLEKVFDIGLTIEGVSDVEDGTGASKTKGKKRDASKVSPVRILFRLNKSIPKKKGPLYVERVQEVIGQTMPYSIMVTDRADDGINVAFRYTNIPDIVNDWITWRLDFEVRVVERLIEIEETRITRLNWLIWAVDHLDLVFAALRTNDPEGHLVKKGKIKPEAAKYIMDQQVRRLSKLEADDLRVKVKEATATVKAYRADIKTKDAVAKRVYKQLSHE